MPNIHIIKQDITYKLVDITRSVEYTEQQRMDVLNAIIAEAQYRLGLVKDYQLSHIAMLANTIRLQGDRLGYAGRMEHWQWDNRKWFIQYKTAQRNPSEVISVERSEG